MHIYPRSFRLKLIFCFSSIIWRFPLRDRTLLAKWIQQVRRKDWTPTKSSFLCSKHFTEDSYHFCVSVKGRKLIKGAVPTIFSFPSYRELPNGKRRKLSSKKRLLEEPQDTGWIVASDDMESNLSHRKKKKRKHRQLMEELQSENECLRKHIKLLQQHLRRKNETIETLQEQLQELEDRCQLDQGDNSWLDEEWS